MEYIQNIYKYGVYRIYINMEYIQNIYKYGVYTEYI